MLEAMQQRMICMICDHIHSYIDLIRYSLSDEDFTFWYLLGGHNFLRKNNERPPLNKSENVDKSIELGRLCILKVPAPTSGHDQM